MTYKNAKGDVSTWCRSLICEPFSFYARLRLVVMTVDRTHNDELQRKRLKSNVVFRDIETWFAGSGHATQRDKKQPSRRGQDQASTEEEIPRYYYEWAETIRALPGPEQVNTLAAMPEDDARTINKILRQRGRTPSMDASEEHMLAEAKRRSLRYVLQPFMMYKDEF